MPGTRKSHFLSRFYLRGFTQAQVEGAQLHVRSKKQERSWTTRYENVAHKRDLFRPASDNIDPDELVDGFAELEGTIAPVLKWVLENQRIPTTLEEQARLLHLPALNAARPPAEIQEMESNIDVSLRHVILEELTPERHREILEEWKREGRDSTHVEDLDALKERITAGRIKGVLDRDHVLLLLLQRAAVLVELYLGRSWALLVSDDADHFVCSDRPVSLVNNRNLPEDLDARFDDPRFDVVMPLSRRLCLVGRHVGRTGAARACRQTVGFVNLVTVTGAADYVYSAGEVYPVAENLPFNAENTTAYAQDLAKVR